LTAGAVVTTAPFAVRRPSSGGGDDDDCGEQLQAARIVLALRPGKIR